MRKFLFLLIVFAYFAVAQEVNFYSSKVQKDGELVKSDEEVLIFSDEYFINADKAEYNQTNNEVELFGNINILRGENERFNSCYARLNLNTNEAKFKDFFFADNDLEVWFQSGQSDLNSSVFIGKDSAVSSCDVNNPDWQIRFSKGEFKRSKNYLHLYHAKLYVKNVPVFYLPYLGFSIDTSRKTGFLVPDFEFNRDDGFYYNQPFFLALYDEWDLEYRQQVRASRGVGGYATFRFMDSPYSSGMLNGGIFREKSSYFRKEGLKNQIHKGIELQYLRDNLFKKLFDLGEHTQEGLWIDGTYLNDVDYLNLEQRNYKDLTSLVTSEFNYFFADENNYYSTYAKYYIDTSKVDNKDTLQEYPSFQYHRFLNGAFNNIFQYSFDARFNRYYRDIGIHANTINLNLPLSVHFGLFDDFVHFKFTEKLYASFVNYYNYTEKHEHLYRNDHEFSLYTELSKPYNHFFHTLYLGTNYLLKGEHNGIITQNFLPLDDESERFALKVVQYFYNQDGEKKLKHRVNVNYDAKEFYFLGLENLAQYFFNDNISIRNEVSYSKNQKRFTKSLSSLEINTQKFNFNLSHAYKYDSTEALNQDKLFQKHNFIGANADYTYNINYKFVAGAWFDTQRADLNAWEIGYTYQRKCWNYSLLYKERIDPQLTSAGIRAKTKNGVYFTFNFYPIGGVRYDVSLQERTNAISGGVGSGGASGGVSNGI